MRIFEAFNKLSAPAPKVKRNYDIHITIFFTDFKVETYTFYLN